MGVKRRAGDPSGRSWGAFPCTRLLTSSPTMLHRGVLALGVDRGSPMRSPLGGRKWAPGARGGLRPGFSSCFSPRNLVFYAGAVGAPAGRGGQFRGDPPRPDGFFIKCRSPGRKRPLEGTPRCRRSGAGSTRAPGSPEGIPGESPLPRPVPPDTKRAQEARGARVCQFQRSASDLGCAFVNNLPFFTRRADGWPPPPPHANPPLSKKRLKPDWGFCRLISSSAFPLPLPPAAPSPPRQPPPQPAAPPSPPLFPPWSEGPLSPPAGPRLAQLFK